MVSVFLLCKSVGAAAGAIVDQRRFARVSDISKMSLSAVFWAFKGRCGVEGLRMTGMQLIVSKRGLADKGTR